MFKRLIPALLIGAVSVLATSCKKDPPAPEPTTTNPTTNPAGVTLPGASDGAFYSAFAYIDGSLESIHTYGWFGNQDNASDGGILSLNGTNLDRDTEEDGSGWYGGFGDESVLDSCSWSSSGSSNFPAFSHKDTQSYSLVTDLTWPDEVNNGQGVTINFTTPVSTDMVIVTLGNFPTPPTAPKIIHKTVSGGAKTVSYSASEVASLKNSFGYIQAEVTTLNFDLKTFGAKKYYFVKQGNYLHLIATN